MPAVVRVKRRIDEEPLCAFVLNSKKRRTDAASEGGNEVSNATTTAAAVNDKDEVSTILKFAGTITEQDDTATITQYARLTKAEAKDLAQKKSRQPHDQTERLRQETRQNTQESRFRIVNCMRTTLNNDEQVADGRNVSSDNELTIVDIEKQTNEATTTTARTTASTIAPRIAAADNYGAAAAPNVYSDSDTGYVYDLYLPENEQLAENVDFMDDNFLSVQTVAQEYDCRDDVYQDESDGEKSDIDYPDEDEFYDVDDADYESESDDTFQMRAFMERFDIGSASSDDSDGPFVTSFTRRETQFADDVDRYGLAYAKYKKRINPNRDDDEEDEDDCEEVYNDSYDSDAGSSGGAGAAGSVGKFGIKPIETE